MKITLEHYDTKITIETKHDDVNIQEIQDLLRSLCLAAGYSQENINEIKYKANKQFKKYEPYIWDFRTRLRRSNSCKKLDIQAKG